MLMLAFQRVKHTAVYKHPHNFEDTINVPLSQHAHVKDDFEFSIE